MHRQGSVPELLIPASGPEALKVAVHYGADAVYIGGEAFSLRAKAINFTDQKHLDVSMIRCREIMLEKRADFFQGRRHTEEFSCLIHPCYSAASVLSHAPTCKSCEAHHFCVE